MSLPFQSHLLDQLPLETIAQTLEKALQQNFKNASVKVVDSPDLTKDPWSLAAKGLGGKPRIADVGGVDNLNYCENRDSTFHYEDIAKTVGLPNAFLMGPGAGSYKIVKVNSELMANANLESKDLKSKYSIVTEDGGYVMHDYNTTQFGLMGNFLVSKGETSKVLEVKASVRTGKLNFVTCMRKALEEQYQDKTIGLAGVFNIATGKIKSHVMPDFPSCDLLHQKQVDEWLRFYEMKAPLTCLSVFINNDRP